MRRKYEKPQVTEVRLTSDEVILAGVAEVFSGVRCLINEVKCRCLGSSYCEFIVSWRKLRACGFSP